MCIRDRIINGKTIFESSFQLDQDSVLVVVSDGVIHAGVGMLLNLGWEWENVNEYLRGLSLEEKSALGVSLSLIHI